MSIVIPFPEELPQGYQIIGKSVMVKRKYQGCCYALSFGRGFDIWGQCDMETIGRRSWL